MFYQTCVVSLSYPAHRERNQPVQELTSQKQHVQQQSIHKQQLTPIETAASPYKNSSLNLQKQQADLYTIL